MTHKVIRSIKLFFSFDRNKIILFRETERGIAYEKAAIYKQKTLQTNRKISKPKREFTPFTLECISGKKKKGERKRIEGKLANGQRLNDD